MTRLTYAVIHFIKIFYLVGVYFTPSLVGFILVIDLGKIKIRKSLHRLLAIRYPKLIMEILLRTKEDVAVYE